MFAPFQKKSGNPLGSYEPISGQIGKTKHRTHYLNILGLLETSYGPPIRLIKLINNIRRLINRFFG